MVDPRPFLEGGELLLFTGLEMAAWDDALWSEYVERLIEADISALALAVGITHQNVPEALTAACQTKGLNLLTVPMETSFVSISQTVASKLEESDRRAAREAVAMQRRLAQAARRGDASQAIASELAAYVAGSVWIMTPDGQVFKHAGSTASPHADVLQEIASHIQDMAARGLTASASWASGVEHTVLQPIGLRSPADAFLAVRTQGALSEYHRTALLTSLSMLTLEFETRAERRHTIRQLVRRALDLLVEGERRTAAVVLQAALPETEPVRSLSGRMAIVRVAGPQERTLRLLTTIEDGRWPSVTLAALDADNRQVHIVVPEQHLDAVIHGLASERLRAGVGIIGNVRQIGASMRSAGQALARTTEANPTVWWQQLRGEGLIGLLDEATRRVLAEELTEALGQSALGYDELMRVAESFVRHHGRMNIVADELGMHRNTARARVQELERALGYDLDDPSARASLWVALQAVAVQTP